MSVAVAVNVPSGTGPGLVNDQVPFGPTVAVPKGVLPGAGPVTATVAPGSPVPLTVSVPLGFCTTGSVMFTIGGLLST